VLSPRRRGDRGAGDRDMAPLRLGVMKLGVPTLLLREDARVCDSWEERA